MLQSLLQGDERGRARARPAGCRTSSGATTCSSSCRTTASPAQRETNPKLIEIARQLGAPLLATNDRHYTHREDHEAHDALLCVQTGAVLIATRSASSSRAHEHYLKTADEMRYLFRELPGGVRQHAVGRRAGRRRRSSSASRSCPTSRCPTGFADDAAVPRPPHVGGRPRALGRRPARRRSSSALAVRARRHRRRWASARTSSSSGTSSATPGTRGIRVGPGRGSAAGCAVAYCLRITDLDPIQLRPAVRALPQPEPDLDARHRHGLRLPLPGRDDPLRRRALRPRPRRPDHHVRHDQGPQRRARRGPGARLPVRRRRQASPRPCRRS